MQAEVATGFIALVPAAGLGERYGEPKQLLEVAGKPLLAWTVERLLDAGAERVVVALSEELLPAETVGEDRAPSRANVGEGLAPSRSDTGGLEGRPYDRIRTDDVGEGLAPSRANVGEGLAPSRDSPPLGLPTGNRVTYLAGGASRQESVRRCLEAAPGSPSDLILVHDGVRPAVTARDVRAVVEAAAATGGAILGRGVHDTVKEVEAGAVLNTIDRRRLFRAETPQVFRRELLERAFDEARRRSFVGTDEASLVERLGEVEIRAVEAIDPNPKLTHRRDLALIETLLGTPTDSIG